MIDHIVIPPDLNVLKDKKGQFYVFSYPLEFPSGQQGWLMVTRMNKLKWQPSLDIESITIKYKDDEDKPKA